MKEASTIVSNSLIRPSQKGMDLKENSAMHLRCIFNFAYKKFLLFSTKIIKIQFLLQI